MKQLLSILLAFALAMSVCACGASKESTEEQDSNQDIETADATLKDEKQQSGLTFEANKDLKVVAAFVYDGDTYVVLENVGNQAILNCSVAYINFDKNGFITTTESDGYDGGQATAINLMPNEKKILSWYGATGNYAVATILGADYADGTTWEATGINHWAEKIKNEFSVENQKAMIEEMKTCSTAAETNEYASLTDYSIKHDNQFSSDHDLHFSVQNTSNQGITTLRVFVLEFDESGFPVSVSPSDTYCKNGHSTGGTVNLAAGQSGDYVDDLFISPTTTQIKVIISRIEFQDGTEWENPYLYEWIIGNNQSY